MDKPLTSSQKDFEIRLPEAKPSNAFLVFFVPWWFIFCHIRVSSWYQRALTASALDFPLAVPVGARRAGRAVSVSASGFHRAVSPLPARARAVSRASASTGVRVG